MFAKMQKLWYNDYVTVNQQTFRRKHMVRIDIKEGASYNNLDTLKKFWHDSWILQRVEIGWNTHRLPDDRNPETWPLKATFLDGRDEIIVRIYSLAVGYEGTGPHDLITILRWLGVRCSEQDILTKRLMGADGWIHIRYDA